MKYFNKKNQVIVIGSGIAGLCTSVSLAKAGKQVKILERNSFPGGSIKKEGNEMWAFHSDFLNLNTLNTDNKIFRNLTGDRIEISNDSNICEKVIFKDGTSYNILNNKLKFISKLKNDFPGEIIGLVSFFNDIDYIVENSQTLIKPRLLKGFLHYLSKIKSNSKFKKIKDLTLDDLLNKHLNDSKLKTILSLHCGKILVPPKNMPFKYYSIIRGNDDGISQYINTETIIESLLNELHSNGGSIEYNREVQNILYVKNKISGIELSDGEVINCSTVVSSIGISKTHETLIKDYISSKKYNMLNSNIDQIRSYIKMNIGLDGDLDNIDRCCYRVLSKTPFDFDNDPTQKEYRPNHVIITFPSIKNPSTAQFFIPVNCKYFTYGREYTKLKEDLTNTILDIFEKQFPGISKKVIYTNLSLPLNNKDFCFPSVVSDKISDMVYHPASDIKGLYFTGEDILTSGITGACIGGVITASNIVKKNLIKVFE